MFQASKLTDCEISWLAYRLQAEFIKRKQAIHGPRESRHAYSRPEYLDTFRAAVKSHHPRHFAQILDGAFADPQPEDLVGEEALERTRSGRSQTRHLEQAWANDLGLIQARLDREQEWLQFALSDGEYPGQAVIRYIAALRQPDGAVPTQTLETMAREAVLEAKIHEEIVDELDFNLEGTRVTSLLEEASVLIAEIDESNGWC